MSAPRYTPKLDAMERDTLRMNIQTLEARAAAGKEVIISDKLARVIARQLRRLMERGE